MRVSRMSPRAHAPDAARRAAAPGGLCCVPSRRKKKPGPREPGLRYWPREADTITFQEGLLNHRATGGGGHMRDAIDQRSSTMILISAVRQPSEPHVSHAVSGPFIK